MSAVRRQSVVFIDLDHTLLEGPFETVVFPMLVGEMSKKCGIDYIDLLTMVRQENRRRQNDPAFSAVQAMDWDDIFSQTAQRYGICLQINALDLVLAHCNPPHTTLHEGAREALGALVENKPDRALVLATKGLIKYQRPLIQALGLTAFFDDILTPDTSNALKNTVDFYSHWPSSTHLQIMVGDDYLDDVLPANAFGFKTVWLQRSEQVRSINGSPPHSPVAITKESGIPHVQPDAVISSLYELPRVISRLEHESLSN